LLRRLRRVWE